MCILETVQMFLVSSNRGDLERLIPINMKVFFQLHIPLRLLCGGLLFTCNAVMWTFLAKALRYSSSSTRTTVTTTASNFISSVSSSLFHCSSYMYSCLFSQRHLSSSLSSLITDAIINISIFLLPWEAFLGQLIFGEAQITLWWVGISLTFSGLLVLQRVSPQDHQNAVANKDE